MRDASGLERIGNFRESRQRRIPIVDRRLQRICNRGCIGAAREIARHDDQPPVAAVLQ
jgi:hypothetical protein